MKTLLTTLVLLVFSNSARAEQQPWSEEVNGLRARFSIEREKDSPFLKIFIEIQNTSDVAGGALGDGGLAGGGLKLAQHRDDGGELALGMIWG